MLGTDDPVLYCLFLQLVSRILQGLAMSSCVLWNRTLVIESEHGTQEALDEVLLKYI